MRQTPRLSELPRFPVVAGTALLAIGVTVAWWSKVDVSPLFENAMIRRGELWRLVTSIFPHIGLLHLAFNVYWLWVFGTVLEEVYGHLNTAALILLFATGSNALEFAIATGGVGLSGVGYGFFGLLWVLSSNDDRFRDAIDRRTVELFVVWFFFCIIATLSKIMPVANIAHAAGAILGILTGFAISRPERRVVAVASLCTIFLFGIWGSTFGRPKINLSKAAGYEEGQWGYQALLAHNDREAVRWLKDAISYRQNEKEYWHDLAVAYQELGNNPAAVAAYERAANEGDLGAASYLATLYDGGIEGVAKDDKQAVYWYRKAASGNDPETLNNIAWAYATSRNPEIHNPTAALEYARKAVGLDHEPVAYHLDTLAEAYYANGLYEEAVQTERQAIALAPVRYKQQIEDDLKKYEQALRNQKLQHNIPARQVRAGLTKP